jgi:hypothetical protein
MDRLPSGIIVGILITATLLVVQACVGPEKATQTTTAASVGPTGTIVGTVVEHTDTERRKQPAIGVVMEAANDHVLRQATTDSNGHFEIGGLPYGTYSLMVKSDEYQLSSFTGQAKKGMDDSLVIELVSRAELTIDVHPVGTISGKIYDSDTGKPIPKAGISTFSGGDLIPSPYFHTTSGSDGTFQMKVEAGEWPIYVASSGYLHGFYSGYLGKSHDTAYGRTVSMIIVRKGETVRNVDIGLVLGGSIKGRVVTSDGVTPVHDTYVQIEPHVPSVPSDRPYIKTDETGAFTFVGLDAGEYTFVTSWNGLFTDGTDKVSVALGQLTVADDIRLVPGGSISGQIVAKDGTTPVSDVQLSAHNSDGFGYYYVKSDANGHFVFENVAPGKYSLDIYNYGYRCYTKQTTPDGVVKVAVHTLSLTSGQEITGIEFMTFR